MLIYFILLQYIIMKNFTLLYYVFQHEASPQYNICKIKTELNQSKQPTQIKMKEVLKTFPFDALSGNYHFRFKSQFKENGENIIGWIDITNINSKVPIFNGSVYVKILQLKNPGYNKVLTGEKLQKIREETPEKERKGKKVNHSLSGEKNPHIGHKIQESKKNSHSSIDLLDHDTHSPSPVKTENSSSNINPSAQSNNIFLLSGSSKKEEEVNTKEKQKEQKTATNKFDETPEEIIKRAREGWDGAEEKMQGERQAAIEFDQKIQKWAYTMKTRNNFRTLLITVHQIWPFGRWQQVDLGKLLTENELKKYYRKAMLVFHSDKNPGASHRQVYLGKRIFFELNAAFYEKKQ